MKSEGRVAAEPFICPLPPSLLFFFFSRERERRERAKPTLSLARMELPPALAARLEAREAARREAAASLRRQR